MKISKKKKPIPVWAKMAARQIAEDGLKYGWPTRKGMKDVVEVQWGGIIRDSLRFFNSELWDELGLPRH